MAQRIVVRAVAVLSAKTKSRKFTGKVFQVKQNKPKKPTTLQSPGECRGG